MKLGDAVKCAICALALGCYDAPVAQDLERLIGGSGKDGVRKMIRTREQGFLLGGWQDQRGLHETGTGLVVCLDEKGSVVWRTTLSTNGRNQVSSILQRPNGSFVAVVEEYPAADDPGQVVLFELDAQGLVLDRHRVGGPGSDVADGIRLAADGGYVLAGESSASAQGNLDAWVAKLSSEFALEWEWRQGTPGRDRFNDLILLPDGSIFAAGNGVVPGSDGKWLEQAWLVKLDSQGRLLWSSEPVADRPTSIRGLSRASDGGVVFAGFAKGPTNAAFDSWDAWVGKVSSTGALQWHHPLTITGPDYLHAVTPVTNGTYLAAGALRQTGAADFDALLVGFNEDGSGLHSDRHGGPASEQARAVLSLGPDNYVLAGTSTQDESRNEQMWFFWHRP